MVVGLGGGRMASFGGMLDSLILVRTRAPSIVPQARDRWEWMSLGDW